MGSTVVDLFRGNEHPFTTYDLGYHLRTRVLSHNHRHVFGVCHPLGFALVTSWWVSIRIFSHSSPPLMAQVWNVQLAPGARQNLPVALSVQQGAGVTIWGLGYRYKGVWTRFIWRCHCEQPPKLANFGTHRSTKLRPCSHRYWSFEASVSW